MKLRFAMLLLMSLGSIRVPAATLDGLDESLVRTVEAAQYAIRSETNGRTGAPEFVAQNPAQRMRANFSPDGMSLNSESWESVWRLRSVGYGDRQLNVGAARLQTNGKRIEMTRGQGVVEWYVNEPTGLEQGFTLSHPPVQGDTRDRFRVEIELAGDLHARVLPGGDSAELLREDGSPAMRYDHLVVTDATGRRLPAGIEGSGRFIRIEVDDRKAVWPVTIDPTLNQQAYLKASNTGRWFGYSTAAYGDTVAVGTFAEDSNATGIDGNQTNRLALNAGAVYVFVRNNGSWSQQAYIKASNTETLDAFGSSLALFGDTLVVGAPNEDSASTSVNGDQSSNSAEDSGAAYVFVRTGNVWSQRAYLKASNAGAGDRFGSVVALDRDRIVVGAPGEASNANAPEGDQTNNLAPDSGAAYVFERKDGEVWSQAGYLKGSNTGTASKFGFSVAVADNTIVVGAPTDSSFSGAAYVFVPGDLGWTQQSRLVAPDSGSWFGATLAASGDTIAVADWFRGGVWIFDRKESDWSAQTHLVGFGYSLHDAFTGGASLALSGDTLVVGDSFESSNATGTDGDATNTQAPGSGAAFVFVRNAGVWSRQTYLKASNAQAGDRFGLSVALAGDTVVAGALKEASNATGVNGDQSNNLSFDKGAVYVFAPLPNDRPTITPVDVWQREGEFGIHQIATVGDLQDPAGSLVVTVQNPSPELFTISEIKNIGGSVTANVAVRVLTGIMNHPWILPVTLRVTDSMGGYTEASFNIYATPLPYITARTPITVSEGTPEVKEIAIINDFVYQARLLPVTIQGANPSNGVTISDITNDEGVIRANITAAAGSSAASFVLRVTNGGGVYAEATLDVHVRHITPLNVTILAGTSGRANIVSARVDDSEPWYVAMDGARTLNGVTIDDFQIEHSGAETVSANISAAADASNASFEMFFFRSDFVRTYFTVNVTVTHRPTLLPRAQVRLEGSSAIAAIATVSDVEDSAGSLTVTVQGVNPSNGVTISGITNDAGSIIASIDAAPGASNASFILRVTDSSGAFTEGTLDVTVTHRPTISVVGPKRQQGVSGSSLIATVNDVDDAPGSLLVTIDGASASNGVTISGITNTNGLVSANVDASCTAMTASFTLRVTDSGGLSKIGILTVLVTPSVPSVTAAVGTSSLWPANSNLINVGLAATVTGNCVPKLQVLVYSNEDDETPTATNTINSPDAANVGNATLRLRAERVEGGAGRVYLIVARASNAAGNSAVTATTVIVPKNQSNSAIVDVMAASARTFAIANDGNPPAGYVRVGDGRVIGPKQ